MTIIIVANILVILAIAIQVYRKETDLRSIFWPALMLKIAAGCLLGWLYFHYYTEGDTIAFFHDAQSMAQLAKEDLFRYMSFLWNSNGDANFSAGLILQQPRALFLAKTGSVLCLFTGSNYWIIASWFSLLSFLSAWLLVKELIEFKTSMRAAALIAFLFFPSIVFWSSGFMKESFAFAALCFVVTVFLRVWRRQEVSTIWYLVLPFALWLLWNLKYYYLAILFPVLAAELLYEYFIRQWVEARSRSTKALAWAVVFIVPMLFITLLHPNFNPSILLEVITTNHDAFVSLSNQDEVIHYYALRPTVSSMVLNAPLALFSGLFRPFPWEANSVVAIVASLENVVFLILTVFAIANFLQRKQRVGRGAVLILIYAVLLCVLLALSTPNFGTLSRYRIGFLPFLALLIFHGNPLLERLTASNRLVR